VALSLAQGALFAVALAASPVPILLWLRFQPPRFTAFMLRCPERDYRWVGWGHIAARLKAAVLAAEDDHFDQHRGFDFPGMRAAWRAHLRGEWTRGASTLSQQLVKNLFLWPARSVLRKLIEAYLTLLMEWLWPKRRILEVYLNVAEFGPGIYGVEAASRRYFGKPAAVVTLYEALRLAAVLPAPRRRSATAPSAEVLRYVDQIRKRAIGGRRALRAIDPPAIGAVELPA
jgi:monofunctional biosynthetic peptidoglycan transglycosylase